MRYFILNFVIFFNSNILLCYVTHLSPLNCFSVFCSSFQNLPYVHFCFVLNTPSHPFPSCIFIEDSYFPSLGRCMILMSIKELMLLETHACSASRTPWFLKPVSFQCLYEQLGRSRDTRQVT